MKKCLKMQKIRIIGEGTYGKVYESKDSNGKMYAIKRMFGHSDIIGIKNVREINFLTTLRHPCIVSLDSISFGSPFSSKTPMTPTPDEGRYRLKDDTLSIIMEKCEFTLENYSEQCIIKKDYESLKICMVQVLLALEFFQESKIFHRDIKPQNCLVDVENEVPYVKICDFGISRIENSLRPSTPGTSTSWYRSPEVCIEVFYDYKADIWSAGCVFYEIIAGSPFVTTIDTDKSEIILAEIYNNYPIETKQINDQYIKNKGYKLNLGGKDILKRLKKKIKACGNNESDFNKSSGNINDFCDLLKKMLEIDPMKRYDAKKCLQHSFFKKYFTYIRDMKEKNPIENYRIRKVRIINCIERRWGANLLLTLKKKSVFDYILGFSSMYIFDRYLSLKFEKDHRKNATKDLGKIMTQLESELTMCVCFYLIYKFIRTFKITSWNKIIPIEYHKYKDDLILIEKNLVSKYLNYEIYIKNLIDYIDEEKKQDCINNIFMNYLCLGQDFDGTLTELYEGLFINNV